MLLWANDIKTVEAQINKQEEKKEVQGERTLGLVSICVKLLKMT